MTTGIPVTIELVCRDLPGTAAGQAGNLRLGIQRGREVTEDVPVDVEEIIFRFALEARLDPASHHPIFVGAHAQGTPAERFVYLCWGQRDGTAFLTEMRTKIPLPALTWDEVRSASASSRVIRALLRLRKPAGQPITGTLKEQYMTWEHQR